MLAIEGWWTSIIFKPSSVLVRFSVFRKLIIFIVSVGLLLISLGTFLMSLYIHQKENKHFRPFIVIGMFYILGANKSESTNTSSKYFYNLLWKRVDGSNQKPRGRHLSRLRRRFGAPSGHFGFLSFSCKELLNQNKNILKTWNSALRLNSQN